MSYILDALRRADAERTRGAVPGLHAQNIPADDEPAARNFKPLWWAAGGAGVLLAAVVAVLVLAPWRGAPVPRVPSLAPAPELEAASPRGAPAATAQGETPAARPGGLDPAAMPVEPPIARQDAAPRRMAPPDPAVQPPPGAAPPDVSRVPPPLAQRAAEGRVATLEPRGAVQAGAGQQTAPNRAPEAAAPANNGSPYVAANARAAAGNAAVEHYGAPVANAAQAPARIPNLNELTPADRAALPRLAVGGAIYSESAPDRMLILNGQVFHEGDKPAADTVLEHIRLKSAVLNTRGQRYEITY